MLFRSDDREDGDESKTAQRLLWEVLEFFGVYKGIRVELDVEEIES